MCSINRKGPRKQVMVQGMVIPGWAFCDPVLKLSGFGPIKDEESELGGLSEDNFHNTPGGSTPRTA